MPRKMNFGLIIFVTSIFVIIITNAEEYRKIAVQLHNKFRLQHGSPLMKLDCELNSIAVRCADHYLQKGTIDHSCSKGGNGENLFSSWGGSTEKNLTESADKAVTAWYGEIKKYNFSRPGFTKGTGHFTQVVWVGSTKLGMGVASKGKGVYVVGIYNPHGNVVGGKSFANNVKPPVSKRSGKVDEVVENADCGAASNLLESLAFRFAAIVPVLRKSRIFH